MKKILLIFTGLVFALAVAGAVIPYFVPDRVFKPVLTRQMKKHLGRDVKIDGAVRVRFFPLASAHMEKVSVPGLMRIGSLDVSLELLPLLSKKVEIKSFALDRAEISLRVNKADANNWQLGDPKTRSAGSPIPDYLMVRRIAITDSRITYDDERSKTQWTADKINLTVSASGMEDPLTMRGDMVWKDMPMSGSVDLSSPAGLLGRDKSQIVLNLKSGDASLAADGEMIGGVFRGRLEGEASSLAGFAEGFPAAAIALRGDAEIGPGLFRMEKAEFTLGETKASGSIKYFTLNKRPRLDADITAGKINLDPFLPADKPEAPKQNETGWSEEKIDTKSLADFDLVAVLRVEGLHADGIDIGKATFRVKLENGRFSADMADAEFYGGKASVFASGQVAPVLTVEKRIMMGGVDVAALLGDDRISGKLSLQMGVATRGGTQREMISGMAGNGNFAVADGKIKGFDLLALARSLKGGEAQTPFAELKGSFTMENGIARNDDLALTSEALNVTGKGTVNLPARTLDYRLLTRIGKAETGLPLIVEGSFDKPSVHPDVKGAAEEIIRDPKKAKETLKDVKQQLRENKGALKDVIKGLR